MSVAPDPCSGSAALATDAQPCPPSTGRWVLAATVLGSSMAFIDGTVVNVALPVLQRGLGVACPAPNGSSRPTRCFCPPSSSSEARSAIASAGRRSSPSATPRSPSLRRVRPRARRGISHRGASVAGDRSRTSRPVEPRDPRRGVPAARAGPRRRELVGADLGRNGDRAGRRRLDRPAGVVARRLLPQPADCRGRARDRGPEGSGIARAFLGAARLPRRRALGGRSRPRCVRADRGSRGGVAERSGRGFTRIGWRLPRRLCPGRAENPPFDDSALVVSFANVHSGQRPHVFPLCGTLGGLLHASVRVDSGSAILPVGRWRRVSASRLR